MAHMDQQSKALSPKHTLFCCALCKEAVHVVQYGTCRSAFPPKKGLQQQEDFSNPKPPQIQSCRAGLAKEARQTKSFLCPKP